ncbi:MAG: TIGR03560 family F420-dependent LLM class oxidoreductase [Chloroflexota bacterium]|nr:TIGR03560 family F420-dependent LLM class oxidoreductase [Chloroflexota bacterium]
MNDAVKLGVLIWPQYTDWRPLQEAARRADELGFDSLWTWDHLYPIVGDWRGPIFEGYLTLAGWAGVTGRATLGLMVGANTFRNPALVVKMATTLDHMSGGRAVLGIGGAWFEREHKAYGIHFGSGFGERLDRLDEAVALMRDMLDKGSGSARGRYYNAQDVRNDPAPVQRGLPILIGGGGERKTLKTVAKYADGWNVGGDLERVRHKDEVLRRWCEEVGRDHRQIERTLQGGSVVLRRDPAEARRVAAEIGRHNGGWRGPDKATTADQLVERFAPYLELGFRHIYFDLPAPFDMETLERLVTEVRPALEQAARGLGSGDDPAGERERVPTGSTRA